jgi:hypothetical protein
MIDVQKINIARFELLLLTGGDPLLPGQSRLNFLQIIALNARSTPCLSMLIRYSEHAVIQLTNRIDQNGDIPCRIPAKDHDSGFIPTILQPTQSPVMIKNGERKSPLDFADDQPRKLLTTRNVIRRICRTLLNHPHSSSFDEIEDFVDTLMELGCSIPDGFKPTHSRLHAGLIQYATLLSCLESHRISG